VLGRVEVFDQADAIGSPGKPRGDIGAKLLPLRVLKTKPEGIPIDLNLHLGGGQVDLGGAFLQFKGSRRPLFIGWSHIPGTTGQKRSAGAKAQPKQTGGEHLHRPEALGTDEADSSGVGLELLQGSTSWPLGRAGGGLAVRARGIESQDLARFQHALETDCCSQG